MTPFDPNKEIGLQCDASKDAMGCCLMQEGKTICFASRSLSEAECNYAQIEKEFLSITFACKKFHNLVYGHKIQIFNHHQPLIGIVKKNLDKIRNNRLRRLRMSLLNYDFELHYLPGSKMYIADLLSRNVIYKKEQEDIIMRDVVHALTAGMFSISDKKMSQFQKATTDDEVLSQVVKWYNQGWPNKFKEVGEINHYFKLRNDNCRKRFSVLYR